MKKKVTILYVKIAFVRFSFIFIAPSLSALMLVDVMYGECRENRIKKVKVKRQRLNSAK